MKKYKSTVKEPKWYTCVDCKDDFIWVDHKSQLCAGCEEKRDKKIQERDVMMRMMGGSRPWQRWRFESFKVRRGNQDAHTVCKSFDYKNESIYLYGPVGCGKSHITAAMVYDLWEAQKLTSKQVWTGKASSLFRMFRAQDGRAEEELIRKFSGMPLLVIDDLGSEKLTEFSIGILLELIDRRNTSGQHGLIINSNLDLNDLTRKVGDERISSRLTEMCKILFIDDVDHRVEG